MTATGARESQSSRWSMRPAMGRTGPYTSKKRHVTSAAGVGREPADNESCKCCQPVIGDSVRIVRAYAR
jgi:hypothetical protein